MQDVAGKVALVTGAAGGIGLGMAQAFRAAGMKVVIADVDQAALDAAAESFGGDTSVLARELDVRDPDGWRNLLDEVETSLGPVQLLCNNAGVTTPGFTALDARFDEQDLEEFRWVVDVNLTAIFTGMKAILPRWRKSGLEGHLVNTASTAAMLAFPGIPPAYTATKFGVLGLSESLRSDLKRKGPDNIRVSVVFPGATRSRIHETSVALSPVTSVAGRESDMLRAQRQRNAGGVDPRLVGERVLSGIRRDEFYIFTHPEYRDSVDRRHADILASFAEAADQDHPDRVAVAL